MNSETQMIHSEINHNKPDLKPPFFLKLEDDGSLAAYDIQTRYFQTEKPINSVPPYRLIVSDEGYLHIKDSKDKIVWTSEE